MEKGHFISFIAYLTGDKLQLVKLYPEAKPAAGSRCGVPGCSIFTATATA